MTRCLSCEIHVIYRIVLRFTKEAVKAGYSTQTLEYFQEKHSAHIKFETPEFINKNGKVSMKGAVATILIDMRLPDQKRKTMKAMADGFKKAIDEKFLDEGFIEIHECSDVVELIDWEYLEEPVCKTKKKQ